MPYLDNGDVMPPPFNLIPPPYLLFKLCRKLYSDPRSCTVRLQLLRTDGSNIFFEIGFSLPRVVSVYISCS